jgi:hypothetical protein
MRRRASSRCSAARQPIGALAHAIGRLQTTKLESKNLDRIGK